MRPSRPACRIAEVSKTSTSRTQLRSYLRYRPRRLQFDEPHTPVQLQFPCAALLQQHQLHTSSRRRRQSSNGKTQSNNEGKEESTRKASKRESQQQSMDEPSEPTSSHPPQETAQSRPELVEQKSSPEAQQSLIQRSSNTNFPATRTKKDPRENLTFIDFTPEEKSALRKKYGEKQYRSIELAEEAVTTSDIRKQGRARRDPLRPKYLDDFSRIEPVVDKKIEKLRGEGSDYEEKVAGQEVQRIPFEGEFLWRAMEVVEPFQEEGKYIKKPVKNDKGEQVDEVQEFIRSNEQIEAAAMREHMANPETQKAIRARFDEATKEAQEDGSLDMNMMTEPFDPMNPPIEGEDRVDVSQPSSRDQMKQIKIQDLTYESPEYKAIYARIAQETAQKQAQAADKKLKTFGSNPMDLELEKIFNPSQPDVAPEIPKINDPSVRFAPGGVASQEDETTGDSDNKPIRPGVNYYEGTEALEDESLNSYVRTAKTMGETVRDISRNYRFKVIDTHRVVNQTRMGKIQSIYTIVVAGNQNGLVGLGEGKAKEPDEARRAATLNAVRNMVPILRYENRTVYGTLNAKVSAAEVELSARKPGFGLRVSQHVFEIAKCAGIWDLSARVTRSKNPMNVAKAVWKALKGQRHPEEVAMGRGRKMVDCRKVYYSGLV